MSEYHTPVLLEESVSALAVSNGGIYVDVTFGGGGHSKEILSRMGKDSKLIVFDRDPDAIANVPDDKRIKFVNNNFRFVHNHLVYLGFEKVDGILADLGVSSHQFDTEERGFSFRFHSRLDMRMNPLTNEGADGIIANKSESELEHMFRLYGEVENSRRVAKLICQEREREPIETTTRLNHILESVTPKIGGHKYLAKIYQALRIEVNGEMRSLEGFLNGSLRALKPGGRLVVITYHSLEDRMVKNFMKSGNISGDIKKDFYGNRISPLSVVLRKPLVPDEEEISRNTRARSAKLRVAEKTEV
ncbi:MAG: 16S rRNA (cytosine(1402)-N(4))-methyltransferase RsmH [Bacteroidales bacterium]|jgi:16S rRNA (cytosine1402-N4)-methyltransferase|nr:16S rRNA (cytosine(1402)-N(4))-methyltransferase RsmH [Bacteroidales bacterium]